MSDFVKNNPIKTTFWAEVDDLSILSAACLTFDFEPTALDDYMAIMGEPIDREDLPIGFSSRIEALKSAVRAEVISTTVTDKDTQGKFSAAGTRIPMAQFLPWCKKKGIEFTIPGLKLTQIITNQNQPPLSTSDSLQTITREKMLKIIIGMAIKKYGYTPGEKRNSASGENTGSIHCDLGMLGIQVDVDTIRNYLDEAALLLPLKKHSS